MQASGGSERMKGLLRGPAMSRLTTPSDVNIYGNIHGGTILKMMEEAGDIVATRYCNNVGDAQSGTPGYAVLVRIERMDFLLPMMLGEVAELTTEIVFTSQHSLLVEIDVHAENVLTGGKRRTNYGRFWYVPIVSSPSAAGALGTAKAVLQAVPPMEYASEEQRIAGEAAYREQKEARKQSSAVVNNGVTATANGSGGGSGVPPPVVPAPPEGSLLPETVEYSRVCLAFLVGQEDVGYSGHCRGGVLLKLMDECAGICSVKHCRANVVTACLHATNFHQMIKKGALVTVCGHVTFTSPRSLEVRVIVDFELPFERDFPRRRAVDSFFTYVSIDKNNKALPVPPLKIMNDTERKQYESGQQRYEARKRKAQQQQQQRQQQQQQQQLQQQQQQQSSAH